MASAEQKGALSSPVQKRNQICGQQNRKQQSGQSWLSLMSVTKCKLQALFLILTNALHQNKQVIEFMQWIYNRSLFSF